MRRRSPTFAALVLVLGGCLLGGGCSGTTGTDAGPGGSTTTAPSRPPGTIRVPADQPTIQAAVDAAVPGDLVLISPGTYKETVTIEKPNLVLRGLDRAGVVIDGEGKRENGVKAFGDGVVIENLTVKNHAANGIFVSGDAGSDTGPSNGYSGDGGRQLVGFRVSYVTALANELYGVYAFAAQDGSFDHVYASGSADAGVYVGRCDPCNTVVTDVLAEHNAIGFEGTNASTGLVVTRSTWRANRVGITSNSQKLEKKAPQHDAVIVGNLVDGTDAATSPPQASGAFGLGIAIGGGRKDQVLRNRVVNNAAFGITVTDLDEYAPEANVISDNVLSGNGTDIGVYRTQIATLPAGAACVSGNEATTYLPPDLPTVAACGVAKGTEVTAKIPTLPKAPPGVKGADLPAPLPQPSMPDAATAPARPATGGPPTVDLEAITVPAAS